MRAAGGGRPLRRCLVLTRSSNHIAFITGSKVLLKRLTPLTFPGMRSTFILLDIVFAASRSTTTRAF